MRHKRAVWIFAFACLLAGPPLLPLKGEVVVTREQVQEVTSNLVCLCGCGNKTVSVCGCGVADTVIKEVETMLKEGKTKDAIFAHYISTGGVAVLAAPPKKGFNLIAWVLPFAGVLIAGIFIVGKMRSWHADAKKRVTAFERKSFGSEKPASGDPYLEQLNKELDKID